MNNHDSRRRWLETADLVRPWTCFRWHNEEILGVLDAVYRSVGGGRGSFLEIGTYLGATCSAVALAMPDVEVTTIDLPDPSRTAWNPVGDGRTGEAIRATGARVEEIRMDSADLRSLGRTWDCILVDADHSQDAVYRDLDNAMACIGPGGTVVCHDWTEPGDADRPAWTVGVHDAIVRWIEAQHRPVCLRRGPGWLVEVSWT